MIILQYSTTIILENSSFFITQFYPFESGDDILYCLIKNDNTYGIGIYPVTISAWKTELNYLETHKPVKLSGKISCSKFSSKYKAISMRFPDFKDYPSTSLCGFYYTYQTKELAMKDYIKIGLHV